MSTTSDSIDPVALAKLTEAGFFDPNSSGAAERKDLLQYLLERFSVEELLQQLDHSSLIGVAARAIDKPPRYISAVDVAERAGVLLETVVEFRQALGFPVLDPASPSMPETVVDDVATFVLGAELYGQDAALAFTRVLGWAGSRVMEAGRAMFGVSLERLDGDHRTELEVAKTNELGIASWMRVQTAMVHLLAELPVHDRTLSEALISGDQHKGVAFVDLVGSTSWAELVEPDLHSAALRRFEMHVSLLATEHGARLVKLIGDEAMLVAEDPSLLCTVAWAICVAAKSDPDLPNARAAVGFGEMTARDGDYFGALVNAVARASKLAEPAGILVTPEVSRVLDPAQWTAASIGPQELRGIADPVHLSRVAPRSSPP